MEQGAKEWMVVLEAAAPPGASEIDVESVLRLLEAVADNRPAALHSPDRYALQLVIEAIGPAEALFLAVVRWQDAARRLGVAPWHLARAEVLTPEEFERDCELGWPALLSSPVPEAPGLYGSGIDVREEPDDDLLRMAFHDSLTHLATNGLFRENLEHALARAGRNEQHAVLLLDLDHFHLVNEQLGNDKGDSLLRAVASRLTAVVRSRDLAARLAGDRFAVLLPDTGYAAAAAAARRILEELSGLGTGSGGGVSASVGIAVSGCGQTAEELLEEARAALWLAQEAGGGRYDFYGAGADEEALATLDVEPDPLPERAAYVGLLEQAALAANECRTLEEAARIVLHRVCEQTSWPAGHLHVTTDDDGGEPLSSDIWWISCPARFGALRQACPAGTHLAQRVVASGGPVWIPDTTAESDLPCSAAMAGEGLGAAVAVPVVSGSEVVAVLEFFAARPVKADDQVLEVLSAVATQLGRVVERRRAEAALRESEHRLREAQAMAGLGSWAFEVANGRCTWSEQLCRLFGVDPDFRPTREGILPLVHPDDRAAVAAAMSRFGAGDDDIALEFRVVRPDGQVRWLAGRTSLRREASHPEGVVHGTALDITERKLAEQSLERSHECLRLLLQSCVESLCLLDHDGTVLFSLRSGGQAADDPLSDSAVGQNLAALAHPDDAERVRAFLAWIGAQPGSTASVRARLGTAEAAVTFDCSVANLLDDQRMGVLVLTARRADSVGPNGGPFGHVVSAGPAVVVDRVGSALSPST